MDKKIIFLLSSLFLLIILLAVIALYFLYYNQKSEIKTNVDSKENKSNTEMKEILKEQTNKSSTSNDKSINDDIFVYDSEEHNPLPIPSIPTETIIEPTQTYKYVNKTTGWQDAGGGNLIYMDRLPLSCGANNGLSKIQLYSDFRKNIAKYDYTCINGLELEPIDDGNDGVKVTEYREYNNRGPKYKGDVIYIDKHDIDCGDGAISDIAFEYNTAGNMRYKYKCYEPKIKKGCVERTTVPDIYYNGEFYYLDRHPVTCPDGKFLSRLKLYTKPDGTIYYNYKCCE